MTSYCDIKVSVSFGSGASSTAVNNFVRNFTAHPVIKKGVTSYSGLSEDERSFTFSALFAYNQIDPLGRVLTVEHVISIVRGYLVENALNPVVKVYADSSLYTPLNNEPDAAHIAYEAETVYQIVVNDQKQYRFLNREDSKKVKQLTVAQLNAIVNFSEIEYRWKAGFFTAGKVGLYNVHVNNEGFVTAFRNARDEGFSVMEKYLSGE